MRKIIFISAILLSVAIISCSGDSDSDVSVGYIDPGLGSAKTVNTNKSYNLLGVSESCGPAGNCNAIIYQGTVDNSYVGIAVNDKHDASPDFNLKIYWVDSSIPSSVNIASTGYTIKLIKGSTEYTTTANNLDLTIASQGDGTYLVTFNGTINLGGVSVNSGSTIRAYKYP